MEMIIVNIWEDKFKEILFITLPALFLFYFYRTLKLILTLINNNRKGLSAGPSEHLADRYLEVYTHNKNSNVLIKYGVYRNPNYPDPKYHASNADEKLIRLGLIEKDLYNNIKLTKENWKNIYMHKFIYSILKYALIVIYKDSKNLY